MHGDTYGKYNMSKNGIRFYKMMMMIDVLRPLLCTWLAKWAEQPPKVMKRSKDEIPLRYAHAEIRSQVIVICGPTRYQLDHGGAINVL